MLILQEVDDAAARDRAARRHGRAMLTELRAVQRAMLADTPDPAPLHRLAALAADVPLAADRRLREAVGDVSVRAWVELARFGVD
jgi:plasmid stability protein